MQNLEKRILSKVGKPVIFKYPDGTLRLGTLKDRVILPTQGALSGKLYIDVIDLIEFEDEGRVSDSAIIFMRMQNLDGEVKIH